MQEKNNCEILKKLAQGTNTFFPIINADTGFSVFGEYFLTLFDFKYEDHLYYIMNILFIMLNIQIETL